MGFEAVVTPVRWALLSSIAQRPASPLQLAQDLGMTMANVSMNLKLLEAAGIVTSRHIRERAAGKPRKLYSITRDMGYIATLGQGYQVRVEFELDRYHKAVFALMQIDAKYHPPLMRLIHEHEYLLKAPGYVRIIGGGILFISVGRSEKENIVSMSFDGNTYPITLSVRRVYTPGTKDVQVCFGDKQ